MKTSNFLNVLMAAALVVLAAKLHFVGICCGAGANDSAAASAAKPPAAPAGAGATVIDSTGLLPGVKGFGGPVPVEVEVKDGHVVRVAPKLPNEETPGFFQRLADAGLWRAWDGLPVEVAATSRVDAVTGATYSSEAPIANVRAALAVAAGKSREDFAAEAAARARIALPPPSRSAMPLGEALAKRATYRDFSPEPLTDQELSDLLWAANGINRPDLGKRTAPTAMNRQEIDIYVCRADGAYLWDSEANALVRVSDADLRGLTGRMNDGDANFALVAPIAIVFVIDFERQKMQGRPQDAFKYASVDCGFIGQNIYLHCAATGLHTVFLGSLKPEQIARALSLPPASVPLFAQTVGKPAK